MVIPIKFGININTKVFHGANLRDCFAINIYIYSLAFANIGFVVISIEYDLFGSALICFCRTILPYCQHQFEELLQPA